MDRLFDFTGKVAVVTGGSRGMGREMCLALAERGADIMVVSRKQDACDAVVKEVEALGRRGVAHACNLSHWDACDGLAAAAYEHFGKVDILINNAGMSPLYDKLSDVSEALFDKVIGLNLKGPFRLMALFGERMQADGGGVIINISSTGAVHKLPNAEPYGAAKAGLNKLTLSFAWAFGPDVRVNGIMPGPFLTDIAKAWDMEAFNRSARTEFALQRAGEPDEIVTAVLYLASDASAYTTGTVLTVDGGGR
ncbi:MAG: SDR family oxidoreductase [Pseudomonadota bacterium]